MTRRGVTLIELLVAVAILAALTGLLLPGVQKARAAANRVACASNLRQIGIATHAFASRYGALPAGRGSPAPVVFSPHARLLPDLEQDTVALDFSQAPVTYSTPMQSFDGTANSAAATAQVRAFHCPADPQAGVVPGSLFGTTNYAANAGRGAGTLANADGLFQAGTPITFPMILDGTSQTALFSERLLGGPGEARTVREVPAGAAITDEACDASTAINRERGNKWILGNYGSTLYNHARGPNSAATDCMSATQQQGSLSASARHAGGVHVLFADGSVRKLSDGVTLPVWQALATRSGQEPTP